MNKIQELRNYVDELYSKLEYEDYANLMNLIDEIDTQVDCQEDFRDWIIDNWEAVEDDIAKSIDKVAQEYSENGENFLIDDSVDSDILLQEISTNLQQGLLNVIDTYSLE